MPSPLWGPSAQLLKCLSTINMHRNRLNILLECKLWFSRSQLRSGILHFLQVLCSCWRSLGQTWSSKALEHVLSLNHRARFQGRNCIVFIYNSLQFLKYPFFLLKGRIELGSLLFWLNTVTWSICFNWIEYASGITFSTPWSLTHLSLIGFQIDKYVGRTGCPICDLLWVRMARHV